MPLHPVVLKKRGNTGNNNTVWTLDVSFFLRMLFHCMGFVFSFLVRARASVRLSCRQFVVVFFFKRLGLICRSHLPPRTSAESPATSRLQRSGPNGTNGSIKSGAFSRRSHGRLLQFRSRRRRRYVLIASSTSAFLEIRWVIWLHAFVS